MDPLPSGSYDEKPPSPPPPAYSAQTLRPDQAERPPTYAPPRVYQIGKNTLTTPLVQVHELKAHLALLRAFKNLRATIEGGEDPRLQWMKPPLEPPQRWAWFVGLAVDRFYKWIQVVEATSVDKWMDTDLPPVDVFMVWHAYLLNPFWYAEDCDRLPVMKAMKTLNDRLLRAICLVGDIEQYSPSAERMERWFDWTRTPYHPLDAAKEMKDREIQCPQCSQWLRVPYINANGAGYSQQKFLAWCTNVRCNQAINKDSLAAHKLVNNLVLDHASALDKEKHGHGVFLAGTVRYQGKAVDEAVAKQIKDRVLVVHGLTRPARPSSNEEWKQTILRSANYTANAFRGTLEKALKGGKKRTNRILSAYADDRPFSVELVGAVLRQCSFVDKMHNLGWTEPEYFNDHEDEIVLVHAIARYHAFLDLMSSAPTSFFVPTLDIDLAWHTHQMIGGTYSDNCLKYVGRYVDHDDKVEENHLANAFDVTCRAWEQRFNIPYTHCGCPRPRDNISQKVVRLARRLSNSDTTPPNSLVPPHRPDALSATHASEHNAIFVADPHTKDLDAYLALRERRREKLRKLRERDEGLVRKGKMDEELYGRGDGHEAAFLYPVPLYFSAPASCVCSCGSVVEGGSSSACAVGSAACSGGGCSSSGGCGSGCGGDGCGGGGCGGGCGGG